MVIDVSWRSIPTATATVPVTTPTPTATAIVPAKKSIMTICTAIAMQKIVPTEVSSTHTAMETVFVHRQPIRMKITATIAETVNIPIRMTVCG